MMIYFKLLMTMACWGGTFVAGRLLGGVVAPFHASFLRFAIATAILLVILYRHNGHFPRLNKVQFYTILLLGLTGVLGYNLAFFKGLETVSASRAGLIIALNPVGIALFSALAGGEPLRAKRSLGIIISVIGAMMVISRGQWDVLTGAIGSGEMTLLVCVICWALYSVIGRYTLTGLSPLTAVTYSALAGTILLAPLSLTQGLMAEIVHYDLSAWISILYLAIFGTVAGFIWYYQAIKVIGTVRSGVFINFVPLFALLFGILILGESLTPSLLQGGVLVITGAWITNNDGFLWKGSD